MNFNGPIPFTFARREEEVNSQELDRTIKELKRTNDELDRVKEELKETKEKLKISEENMNESKQKIIRLTNERDEHSKV